MEQGAVSFNVLHTASNAASNASAASEACRFHLDVPLRLLVSSVGVRGLAASAREVPLIMELRVGSCSLLTGQLLPPLAEKDGPAPLERPSSAMTPSNWCQLGLEHLRILIPIAFARGRESVAEAPVGIGAPQNGRTSSVLEGGIRVSLRTANGGILLGSALCLASGNWFPISPCGGEVQVTFKLFVQRGEEIVESSAPLETLLKEERVTTFSRCSQDKGDLPDHGCASAGTDDCTSSCSHMSPAVAATRQARSADVALKTCSSCVIKSKLHGNTLDERGATARCRSSRSSRLDRTFVYPLASTTNATTQLNSELVQRRALPDNHHAFVASSDVGSGELWGPVSQPRSLVFYGIRVAGFLPLSNSGNWCLEFSWPQSQLSATKRIIKIPTHVDNNGAAVLQDVFSIDLPLFMRGEVQTNMHAVWSGDNKAGDTRTPLCVKVTFDPILATVQDSEMQWDEVRCHAAIMFEGVPLTTSNLFVELAVKLEFHEPQRDGRHGRPTSAFPRFAHRRAVEESGVSVDEERESATLDFAGSSRPCSSSEVLEEEEEEEEEEEADFCDGARAEKACQTGLQVGGDVLSVPRRPVTAAPRVCLYRAAQTADTSLLSSCTCHPEAQDGGENERREEERRRLMHSLSLRRPLTAPHRHPCVQDMVPCYSEQQRRLVFQAYDTGGRGRMTQEQLLHFCRAHVALFDAEESDASILRGLRPYVRGGDRQQSCDPAASCPSSRPVTAPRPERPTSTGLSAGGPEDITYNVFEVIALRLASM